MPFCHLRLRGPRPPDFPIPYARNPQTLGEHIRKRRLERGLRQRDLAERFGVTTGTVALWERGRVVPLARQYPGILGLLGYDPPTPVSDSPAERLGATRCRLGLTQEELAERLGLDEETVTAFERGLRRMSSKVRKAVAAFLAAPEGT